MSAGAGPYRTQTGVRFPSGAKWTPEGVNFSVFSRVATAVELLLFEKDAEAPFQTIVLDPVEQRTFFSWHVFVEGVPVGTRYLWRVRRPGGEWREVLDPWARAIDDRRWDRGETVRTGRVGLRGIVCDLAPGQTGTPRRAKGLDGAVIYEMHVGGFTRHPSAGVSAPGTFRGLIEKIPYLRELGVTHVELLPVMAFDPQDVPPAVGALGRENYWGYSTYGFYAPHPGYCVSDDAVREFRELVSALHAADIGVLLDVVLNHTSEGGRGGPAIHFKTLADDLFYLHDPAEPGAFRDYTGCGNTVNCNHPAVTRFLVHCLEYWAGRLRVDGFRFDLASVFARGEDGSVLANPPLPWNIEFSPTLIDSPLIAEAWDAAGLYQVGSFPGLSWSEWNGRYRDVMRRFVRGDRGLVGDVAGCLAGSSAMYERGGRPTTSSINFITCHDGFTLWDLVSYNGKHNAGNGEANRDGTNDNLSWNCGVEGETSDAAVLRLRHQQARSLMALLFLSQGVPMILAGDEVLRTQRGNNNAWCQDNEVSWQDWRLDGPQRDMLRFMRELIAFRRRHASLQRKRFLTGRPENGSDLPDISWRDETLNPPQWGAPEGQVLGFTLAGRGPDEEPIHVMCNMSARNLAVRLPALPGRKWHLAFDTAAASPADAIPRPDQKPVRPGSQTVRARSVVVWEAR